MEQNLCESNNQNPSKMATSCGYECQCKSFTFVDCDESKFYEFQWTKKKLFYVIYRAVTCFYHLAWVIVGWVLAEPDIHYTISNWSFFATAVYFLFAFGTSIFGIVARKDYTYEPNRPRKKSQVSSVTRGKDEELATTVNPETGDKLRWFHKATWVSHVLAFDLVIFVTIFYWAILARDVPIEKLRRPLGQHKHSVQGGLLLIDIFLIAFPTRFLHFVYCMLIAFCFSIYLIIMHFSGVTSRAYPITDFVNNPGLTAGVLCGATFVAPLILHTFNFALYHLRALIYRNTVGKVTPPPQPAKFDVGHDNVVFNGE